MNKKKIVATALTAALAGGCASVLDRPVVKTSLVGPFVFAPADRPKPINAGSCDTQRCWIYVDIVQQGSDCVPVVSEVFTELKRNPQVDLIWEIRTRGYVWPSNRPGVEFLAATYPFAHGQVVPGSNGKQWYWKGRGTAGAGKGGYYAYKIVAVTESAPHKECVLDPGLVTDW